jgi:hypothetical protein
LLKPVAGNAQSPSVPLRGAVAHQNIRTIDVPRCEA